MNPKEFAELVPWLIDKNLEDATSPLLLPGRKDDEAASYWSFRTDQVQALAGIFPERNELRLTVGLVTYLSYTAELSSYINFLNTKQLVFGRAYAGEVPSNTGDRVALLMQEIVFGDGISLDYPPSIENLLRIIATLCGQGGRLARETLECFEGRPLAETDVGILVVHC